MFHNISNPKWFGNWSRLEDDYLGNGGTDIADNFTFSKMEKTGGLFGSIVRLATAFPACDPETGHATGAWKVACESIDLDEVPLSDIADMISGFDCETITDFRLFNTGAFDNTPWQQALGELLLRLRIEKDDYQWIQCPNSESAVNMMNMVMDAHMPKDFFDGFVCGDEEYGLNEEAHEMASGRKEIDTQTETKDAPEVDTDKEVMHLQWMRPERITRTSDRTRSDKKLKDRMPHPVWERHLHKCEKEREVRMMKAEKGSEIITTICEYENSVAMPDNERLTYLDTCGIAHIKDGNGNVKAQEAYANRCSEYLRFGHEVDLAACGAYSPYDALKVCDTPEIFLKTGFEQRPMLYTQKHLFQALTRKSDYNPHRHGFSIEQVKRFPELLASPVVLANSPTRDDVLLAILLATDIYDTPLIAGIKPDGTGNYGEREVETNMVLSVYSRQNFIRYFALLRDMDAFVFVSGRKIEALEDLSGLPLAGNCSGLDIDRILQRPKCLG